MSPNHVRELSLPSEGFAKLPAVMSATGLSRSTIYARVKASEFPAPVKLGARAVAWDVQAIRRWIDERRSESNGSSASTDENAVFLNKTKNSYGNMGTTSATHENTASSGQWCSGNIHGNSGNRAGTNKEGV
jgi:prophage regulatory protein